MNTINPNIYGIQYKKRYNKKQTDNTSKFEVVQADKFKLSKVSTDNIKANYLMSFKGNIKSEKSDNNSIGTVNHQTAFFREPKTDEIVQNYILENFDNDDGINIVSGACSTAEEAKSYAMMLDSIKDRLNIYGFDISAEVIDDAYSGDCQLIKADGNVLTDLDSENILLDDTTDGLSEYQMRCRDKFRQYYIPKGSEYRIEVFPNAKQELEKFEALLNDPIEFEKQKKQYDEQIQALKNANPDIAKYMVNVSFEDSLKMSKEALKRQTEVYKTVRDFSTDMSRFENCTFSKGDVMNLDELYEPSSVNVLLYRNALYHTLCDGDNLLRFMKGDAKDTMDIIANKMNKILKQHGLVVFGEEEWGQGINTNIINEVMRNNGFKLLQEDNIDNIWVKVKDIGVI